MKFIDAIGLKYFYNKLKDKFVQRITYNKKTSADDTTHTNITRAIETPLIIGGYKNDSSVDSGIGQSLYLQQSKASFEDGTGSYIKLTSDNIDTHSDQATHLQSDNAIYLSNTYSFDYGVGLAIIFESYGTSNTEIKANIDRFYIHSPLGNDIAKLGRGVDTVDIKFWSSNGIYFQGLKDNKIIEFYLNDPQKIEDDGLKILFDSKKTYNFSSTETHLLKDVITASKTQIRNRISSTCSTKLTQEKGFQVFTNLYADPEHCTDIADYSDEEKAVLTNNTVQKNILELNKTKTFVDSIKTSNSSIKLTNSSNLYIANNIIDENGITLQIKTNNIIDDTKFKDVLSLTRTGIKLSGGDANKVFATDGSILNLSKMVTTEIASSSWKTSTPFNILDDVVTNIYKGETVGNYTKWILIPHADSEIQKYTAYKKGNANYIYSNYAFDPNQPLLPWEFWLPSNLAVNTVEVDW